jgi:hypothetical protein
LPEAYLPDYKSDYKPEVANCSFKSGARGLDLPSSYPVYCIYIPSGMERNYEIDMIQRLKVWGTNMGQNVFVADWDIGDPSYRDLIRILGPRNTPMIIFTDKSEIDQNSFILAIDDPKLMKDNDQLCDLLPKLANLIMDGCNQEAVKDAIQKKDKKKLNDVLKAIAKANFSITAFGVTVSFGKSN